MATDRRPQDSTIGAQTSYPPQTPTHRTSSVTIPNDNSQEAVNMILGGILFSLLVIAGLYAIGWAIDRYGGFAVWLVMISSVIAILVIFNVYKTYKGYKAFMAQQRERVGQDGNASSHDLIPLSSQDLEDQTAEEAQLLDELPTYAGLRESATHHPDSIVKSDRSGPANTA